jgi:hypothetical protein
MMLSPAAFNAHLNKMGQRFDWRRAYFCPCRNPHSGSADPDCLNCGGKGYAWGAAVSGMSGIAGQKIQREWAQFGLWESGDVVLSIPSDSPLYAMGEFDRVTMTDSSQPFSVQIGSPSEPLRWPVVSIDRVYWLDDGEPVDAPLPSVAPDGVTLQWLPPEPEDDEEPDPEVETGEPPAGVTLSVTGRRRPEYFCWGEYPSDRAHHSGQPLPRRVVLRMFDLYGR